MIDDDAEPKTLHSRSLEGVAKYIKERNIRKIVVMTGAGISTSAGIPDFRSPDTGLYANLARLDLPDPEAVFDISYFRKNPRPFYALAKEMYPGKFRPTIAHAFIRLLHDKRRLLRLFTQNIDCLEREAGVPGEKMVEAHGSFATQSCIDCKTKYDPELMEKAIDADDVPLCPDCMGLVKPDIVFFGEPLPAGFFESRTLLAQAELLIIMGTSLSVFPFASLPSLVRESTPRLLINLTKAGSIGSRADDVLVLEDCDTGVVKLAEALGCKDELESLFAEVNPEEAAKRSKKEGAEEAKPELSWDEKLREEIDRLTEGVEHTLEISKSHEDRVREQLEGLDIKDKDPSSENDEKSDNNGDVPEQNKGKQAETSG